MATDQAAEGAGNPADVPWASVFDPSVNVRALGEIQARGFRAATELVDRFVRMADRMTADAPREHAGTGPVGTENRSAPIGPGSTPDLEKLIGTWQGMVGQWAGSVGASATPAPGRAGLDLVNAESSGHVVLTAAGPGAAVGEVWLHNCGGADLGTVRLRCSDLMAHDGTVVAGDLVRFAPDSVAMPARCDRGVGIEIDVAADVPPGRYRGTLLAGGHGDVWLPVTLVVETTVP